ncbi:MAG: hypothetical protein LC105_00100 [Chitinophagales bacterium]|nr:hypothetical protein [Chitinophagales bacterium]MCZ2392246.1 hypothetical protein [Chitinophagales bacterium]
MTKTLYFFLIVACLKFSIVSAQETKNNEHISKEDLSQLRVFNDSLKVFNTELINSPTEVLRSAAAYKLIKVFSKALRIQGSFDYQFDSLSSISIMTPSDSKFRIFTWQLAFDNGTYRYFGVIQSNDKVPQLQPLVDYGDFYEFPDSIIVDADRWIGAFYYQIIPFKSEKSTFYALLGWDGHNAITNRKYIDILWFDKENKAKFGYPLFFSGKRKGPTRVILEYKKDAVLSLSYSPQEKMIYFDHLTSLSGNIDNGAYDLVPDGTIESYILSKGKWKHIDMLQNQSREGMGPPNVIKEQTKPLYQPLPKR